MVETVRLIDNNICPVQALIPSLFHNTISQLKSKQLCHHTSIVAEHTVKQYNHADVVGI